jgi:hypothetical protein
LISPLQGCSQVTRLSFRSSRGIMFFEFGTSVLKGQSKPGLMMTWELMSTGRIVYAGAWLYGE